MKRIFLISQNRRVQGTFHTSQDKQINLSKENVVSHMTNGPKNIFVSYETKRNSWNKFMSIMSPLLRIRRGQLLLSVVNHVTSLFLLSTTLTLGIHHNSSADLHSLLMPSCIHYEHKSGQQQQQQKTVTVLPTMTSF